MGDVKTKRRCLETAGSSTGIIFQAASLRRLLLFIVSRLNAGQSSVTFHGRSVPACVRLSRVRIEACVNYNNLIILLKRTVIKVLKISISTATFYKINHINVFFLIKVVSSKNSRKRRPKKRAIISPLVNTSRR